ncbi:MAG: DUF1801 domain-containing protein [Saprospiraceae bacterium]|nr:DUF1801 domain-containing protein [Saprospiraceae bacterium]
MTHHATTVAEYLQVIPEERRAPIEKLRETILENLPKGFEEGIGYGMIAYVVPHRLYPAGYHCDPKLPLPFVNIASQKNFIALYHMGLYANPPLLDWFVTEYTKHCKSKLDMGKSCIRFKKPEHIPFALIGALMQKITMEQWIGMCEQHVKR